MSKLTEGLERIYSRFEAHEPHRAHSLQPPLSKEEIEIAFQDLPFPVSPEIYELYQWRDGSSWERFLFQQYDFMSLSHAIREYQGWLKQIQQDHPDVAGLFQFRLPLFQLWSECGVFLMVVPDGKGGSPIYSWDISFKNYALRYTTLTDLILYSAEWYETAVFDEEDHRWVIDDKAESQLDLKYRAQANNRNAPEL
jgi:hypothetical protein